MNRTLLPYLVFITVSVATHAASNTPAAIRNVRVTADADKVSVEVDLTDSVIPNLTFAKNPDRLIADFPNVSPKQSLQHIPVGKNGVARVRIGLNHSSPPITRVVVDLDALRPFSVEATDRKVRLNILPASTTRTAETASSKPPQIASVSPRIAGLTPNIGIESDVIPEIESVAVQPHALPSARVTFEIKGVSVDSVYLDGGTNFGLQVGMTLIVRDSVARSHRNEPANGALAAELRILAVATTSAVAEVRDATRPIRRGDVATLTPQDAQTARTTRSTDALAAVRLPVKTIMPIEPDTRSQPLLENPSGSRIQGRIGLDYSSIISTGSTPGTSTQRGISFQSDMTNLFGTHWNLQGYWRGRINRHSQFQQDTLEDTLNKTYTMQLHYDNPDSPWVAGFGRLYLPWAVSLDTIDGGYFGRKLSGHVTTGIFAGSTPDITSWDYAPDHRIAGSFVNFTGGSFDSLHISSTTGLALSTLGWKLDRPYLFFENEASYKSAISVYHSLIADNPRGVTTNGIRPGKGISRSYLTIHLQPSHRLYFDIYHNYFRDVPTAATTIVGTGLVDKLLFQGLNIGVHGEPIRHVVLYTTLGESEKTGDEHETLNQMYGITWSEILHTGMRADFHHSKFDSNFGRGDYRLLSLSRQLTNHAFWNLQLGSQDLISPFTANGQSKFAAFSMDVNLGKRSYFQSGYTFVNGTAMNYHQWYSSLGFRFDHGKPEAGETHLIPK
ncbi:MAG TPA: AMIN domain-containing protein [Candidatus Sulfotelmatobacter sp.]|nr:AMIN domain-containing protein [Candidatus Sulfotelmatobacter sp.]